jgi:hypothetical protein
MKSSGKNRFVWLLSVIAFGGILLGATVVRQQETWEYHVVYGPVTSDALNRAGIEGWELVSVVQTVRGHAGAATPEVRGGYRTHSTADATTTAIFKRRSE